MAISTQIVNMTPDMALDILDAHRRAEEAAGSPLNRKLDHTRVKRYAREMSEGRWTLNGESVILNGTRILDGNHRLTSVIASGATVPMLVVRGIDESAFNTINQGMPRSASHILTTLGATNVTQKAAAAMLVWGYRTHRTFVPPGHARPSPHVIAEYAMELEPALQDYTNLSRAAGTLLRAYSPLIAMGLLTLSHKREWLMFLQQLETGTNLSAYDPALLCRERLLSVASVKQSVTHKHVKGAWIVKAWNAYITRRPIRQIKFHAETEEFPIISLP